MNRTYVPADLIRPLLVEWLERRSHSVDSYTVNGQRCISARNILAELSRVNKRTIYSILNAERETVEYQNAEKLLLAMDSPEAWHCGELGQWYANARLWTRSEHA